LKLFEAVAFTSAVQQFNFDKEKNMATAAQILANHLNSLHSSGPKSKTGKETSSQNNVKHGLCHHNERFYFMEDEDREKFRALLTRLQTEHRPETETETILVRRLAEHEWLRTRALRLQKTCIFEDQHVIATEQFGLYLRYQTTHERAFYKALTELQKLRAQRTKEQIGFESQKRQAAAENRAEKALNLRIQEFEIKKLRFERSAQPQQTGSAPFPPAEPSPGVQKMAA
jgi:hypothetical protein